MNKYQKYIDLRRHTVNVAKYFEELRYKDML